jgi:hypothetical protein
MVARGRWLFGGDVPKSFISLIFGILAIVLSLVTLSSMIVNPIYLSGEMILEVQDRITKMIIGLVAGFGFGTVSWMVGFVAFPADKSQPHWRTCRICSSIGIGFGVLAILIYLTLIMLLPIPVQYPI